MTTTCVTNCGRPARDSRLLCDHCAWEVKHALGQVPTLLDELRVTLTRQDRLGPGNRDEKTTKGRTQPLPFNVRASEVLDQIRVVLSGWSRVLVEDNHLEPPRDSLRGMARWLHTRVDLLATHEAASDIYDEITDAYHHGMRAIDRAGTKTRFIVGPCPENNGTLPCRGDVWAYFPVEDDQPPRMACAECAASWETHQWVRTGKRILAEGQRRAVTNDGDDGGTSWANGSPHEKSAPSWDGPTDTCDASPPATSGAHLAPGPSSTTYPTYHGVSARDT